MQAETVPARLLLGHRIDKHHVTIFPAARAIAGRFGVESDPAYLLVSPGGDLLFKHVGRISRSEILSALDAVRARVASDPAPRSTP